MSFNWWKDQENVVLIYNGVILWFMQNDEVFKEIDGHRKVDMELT